MLLDRDVDINTPDKNGVTALHLSITNANER